MQSFNNLFVLLQKQLLRTGESDFRDSKLRLTHELVECTAVYIELDIVCGSPSGVIDSIVNSCEFISDSFDVEKKCLVWNWAGDIFSIIKISLKIDYNLMSLYIKH